MPEKVSDLSILLTAQTLAGEPTGSLENTAIRLIIRIKCGWKKVCISHDLKVRQPILRLQLPILLMVQPEWSIIPGPRSHPDGKIHFLWWNSSEIPQGQESTLLN